VETSSGVPTWSISSSARVNSVYLMIAAKTNGRRPNAQVSGHFSAFQVLRPTLPPESPNKDRLTKPNHPWTNGQVERMNRTIKEATVQRYHYDSHNQLQTHLSDFLAAYNFARRLKTLGGLTVYEFICKCWQKDPDRFIFDPTHQMPGQQETSGNLLIEPIEQQPSWPRILRRHPSE
jgi:hypothetical protein